MRRRDFITLVSGAAVTWPLGTLGAPTLQALLTGPANFVAAGIVPASPVLGTPTQGISGIVAAYAPPPQTKNQFFRSAVDGSGQYQLITDPANDYTYPDWSPANAKLVFCKQTSAAMQLVTCNVDGSNQQVLIPTGLNQLPFWQPNNPANVLFFTFDASNVGHLKLVNVNTLVVTDLWPGDPYYNIMGSFSPDGTKIAYTSNRAANGQMLVWIANFDGSNQIQISATAATYPGSNPALPISQKVPRWSPDGQYIAHWEGIEMDYLGGTPNQDQLIQNSWTVYVVKVADGTRTVAGHGDDPIWSPDGRLSRAYGDPAIGGVNFQIMVNPYDVSSWTRLMITPNNISNSGSYCWLR